MILENELFVYLLTKSGYANLIWKSVNFLPGHQAKKKPLSGFLSARKKKTPESGCSLLDVYIFLFGFSNLSYIDIILFNSSFLSRHQEI